ncbi:neo-calmodulin-like [Oculina patagonica]
MAGKSLFREDVPDMVIKSIFSNYDKDGSGCLEKSEILAMLQGDMGLDEKQAEVCFMLIDKDGSKSVTFAEFAEWFRSPGRGFKVVDDQQRYAFVRRVADYFKEYDRDGSGVIDKRELRALLASSNKDWDRCSEEDITQALRAVDKDGSGTVSFSEFLAWVDTRNANGKK